MKKIYQGVLGALFFLGFSIMPVLAEEVEPTEVESLEVTEQTETEPMVEPEEPEVEPISEPEPEVLNGWQEENTKYYIDGKAVDGVQTIDKDVYYFENETLNPYTGFVKNTDNKWIFVRDGKSDWNFTGVAKSIENGKWYHADKGVLNWSFTGLSKSVENGKWYFSRKGALDWSFTGISKSVENGKWYFSRKGALDWKYTGLGKSVENGKLYYCKNGALDWNYTGRTKDGKYVSKGKLLTDPVLIKAAELLWEANGYKSSGWTLKAGYDWILRNFTFKVLNSNSNEQNIARGATNLFYEALANRGGLCYNINSVIYEMGRAMGCNVKLIWGTDTVGDRSSAHSWCEITENGETTILDPDIEIALGVNGWKVKYHRLNVRGQLLSYVRGNTITEYITMK